MCRAATCKTCGKATWTGCGRHVEQTLSGIPSPDRCPGHSKGERHGILERFFGGRS